MKKKFLISLSIGIPILFMSNSSWVQALESPAHIEKLSPNRVIDLALLKEDMNEVKTLNNDDIPGIELPRFPYTQVNLKLDAIKNPNDVYRLNLQAGEFIVISLQSTNGMGANLHLYNSTATTIHSTEGRVASYEGPSSYKTFTFRATHTGVYYLNVHAFRGEGEYTMNVYKFSE